MLLYYEDVIKNLFKKGMYSEVGCNERVREEYTYIYFIDYLKKCEECMQDLCFLFAVYTNIYCVMYVYGLVYECLICIFCMVVAKSIK